MHFMWAKEGVSSAIALYVRAPTGWIGVGVVGTEERRCYTYWTVADVYPEGVEFPSTRDAMRRLLEAATVVVIGGLLTNPAIYKKDFLVAYPTGYEPLALTRRIHKLKKDFS
jgi:hypothetical protein